MIKKLFSLDQSFARCPLLKRGLSIHLLFAARVPICEITKTPCYLEHGGGEGGKKVLIKRFYVEGGISNNHLLGRLSEIYRPLSLHFFTVA